MAMFVVVKGEAWGVKSYALASLKDQQVEAGSIAAAHGKAVRALAEKFPKGKVIKRVFLDLVRVGLALLLLLPSSVLAKDGDAIIRDSDGNTVVEELSGGALYLPVDQKYFKIPETEIPVIIFDGVSGGDICTVFYTTRYVSVESKSWERNPNSPWMRKVR